jgi:hypothetical protein
LDGKLFRFNQVGLKRKVERTQHSRVDYGEAVEESDDDEGQAKRSGELSPPVAREDIFRAERVFDLGEALPKTKGRDEEKTECEGDDDSNVGGREVCSIDNFL